MIPQINKMGKDKKQMKKQHKKRVESFDKQITIHENKLEQETPKNKFTEEYWEKEIDLRRKDKDKSKKYLDKH